MKTDPKGWTRVQCLSASDLLQNQLFREHRERCVVWEWVPTHDNRQPHTCAATLHGASLSQQANAPGNLIASNDHSVPSWQSWHNGFVGHRRAQALKRRSSESCVSVCGVCSRHRSYRVQSIVCGAKHAKLISRPAKRCMRSCTRGCTQAWPACSRVARKVSHLIWTAYQRHAA